MHFSTYVAVSDKASSLEDEMSNLLAPYDEENGGGDNPKWDWYQIGGRWTGAFDDYDPTKDPRNTERCRLCSGTGKRDGQPCNGCVNGVAEKWPTQWIQHPGDIQPLTAQLIERVATKARPHSIVTPDGKWHDVEGNGEQARAILTPLIGGHHLIVVDCHT